jgi:hypothetical protein
MTTRFGRARVSGIVACLLAFAGLARGQGPVTGPAGAISPPPDVLERQRPRPALAPGEVAIDDMILESARLRPLESSVAYGANLESYSARPWEFGVIPVVFDDDVTETQRSMFFTACAFWDSAGVLCIPRTDQPVWVRVRKLVDGCYARVGMGVSGPQIINLEDPGCWRTGTIAHEVGHAFGLIHEHQRADRDTYVIVNFDNVEPGTEDNFDRIVTGRLWTPYDFGSLMHYSRSAFARTAGLETITVRPEYAAAATNMGQRFAPSDGDKLTMGAVYNLPPRAFRTYPVVPRRFAIGRGEALAAMAAINTYYTAPQGLARPNGLSIGGRPDFLGLAAWFFDVYVNTRFAGYAEVESRYNVMASITQTDEWRVKHPGQGPAAPFATGSNLPFDRAELLGVLERLDRFYSAPEGLQRPNGLSLNGQPDFLGIAAWVVDVYMSQRLAGAAPDAAWQRVVSDIQQTDEWRSRPR